MTWGERVFLIVLAGLVVVLCFGSVVLALDRAGIGFIVRELKIIRDRYDCLEDKDPTPAVLQYCDDWAIENNP